MQLLCVLPQNTPTNLHRMSQDTKATSHGQGPSINRKRLPRPLSILSLASLTKDISDEPLTSPKTRINQRGSRSLSSNTLLTSTNIPSPTSTASPSYSETPSIYSNKHARKRSHTFSLFEKPLGRSGTAKEASNHDYDYSDPAGSSQKSPRPKFFSRRSSQANTLSHFSTDSNTNLGLGIDTVSFSANARAQHSSSISSTSPTNLPSTLERKPSIRDKLRGMLFYRNTKSSNSTSQQLQRHGSVDLGTALKSSSNARFIPSQAAPSSLYQQDAFSASVSSSPTPRSFFRRSRTSSCYIPPQSGVDSVHSFHAHTKSQNIRLPQFQLNLELESSSPVFRVPEFGASDASLAGYTNPTPTEHVIEPVVSNDTVVSVTTIREENLPSDKNSNSEEQLAVTHDVKGHSRQVTPISARQVDATTPTSSISAHSARSEFSSISTLSKENNGGDKSPTTPMSVDYCDFVHKFHGALWIGEPNKKNKEVEFGDNENSKIYENHEDEEEDDPFADDQCEDLTLNHRHVRSQIFI